MSSYWTVHVHYSNGGFWLVKPLYQAEKWCPPIGRCIAMAASDWSSLCTWQRICRGHSWSSVDFLLDGVCTFIIVMAASDWSILCTWQRICRRHSWSSLAFLLDDVCIHYSNGGFWLVQPVYLAEDMPRKSGASWTVYIHYRNGGFWLVKPSYQAEDMPRTPKKSGTLVLVGWYSL